MFQLSMLLKFQTDNPFDKIFSRFRDTWIHSILLYAEAINSFSVWLAVHNINFSLQITVT